MSNVTNDISEGIGLWKQVLDLLSAIKGLGIKRPTPNQRKESAQQLIRNLGEWAAEAYPKQKKRWLHPVLRVAPFIKHLKDNGGRCNPQGESTATFGWAKLLYALNIRPGAGVVSWESPMFKFDPISTGVLDLEMEGPVLWHIINLYRLYDVSDPKDVNPVSKHSLSFGTLHYNEVRGNLMVNFEPGDISSKKSPFLYNAHDASSYFGEELGHLEFDHETVIVLYLNALRSGISDPGLKLPNPSTESGESTPLDQRIRELVRVLKELRAKRDTPTKDPYLLTDKWLKQASRIYRRATSQNSTSPTLPGFMVSAFESHGDPNKIQSLDAQFGDSTKEPDTTWRKQALELLQARCMLPNQSLHHVWLAEDESESTSRIKDEISRLIREDFDQIMEAFRKYPEQSLMHTLAKVTEEAKYLLAYSRGYEIRNKPGVVLEFTPSDASWNAKCDVLC